MSAQYSLFDMVKADQKRVLDEAIGIPPDILPPRSHPAFRSPTTGMRFFRVRMIDGTQHVIETELNMLELANEIRGKQKLAMTLADGRQLLCMSADIRSIENEYRVAV